MFRIARVSADALWIVMLVTVNVVCMCFVANKKNDPAGNDPTGSDDEKPDNVMPIAAGLRIPVYREYCARVRTPEEAELIKRIGDELQLFRQRNGFSRSQLANLLPCDLELIVAVENGFGDLKTASTLLASAHNLDDNA